MEERPSTRGDEARADRRRIRLLAGWGASAGAGAALLALALPPWNLWPLAGLALVPWLLSVARLRRISEALAGSLAVGIAWGVASAPFAPQALRSLGAGAFAAHAGFLLGALWAKGLPFALAGGFAYAVRRQPAGVRVLAAAAAFSALDAFHSTSRAGLPWALLGHSQASALGVAQLAAAGGVPVLSGFLAAINQALAIACEARDRARRCGALRLSRRRGS
jgi:apolipoprotein N-acyltransferase